MTYFVGFLFFSFSQVAFAGFDISCIDEDCLTQGWTVTHERLGVRGQVSCMGGDCRTQGWIERDKNSQIQSESRCLLGSCFGEGWEVFDSQGAYSYSVLCSSMMGSSTETNCLVHGWVMFDIGGEVISESTCIASDCAQYGWDLKLFNGNIQVVRCKDESCFTSGWTLRP